MNFDPLAQGMNRWLWAGCLLVLAGGCGVSVGLGVAVSLGLILLAIPLLTIGWRRFLSEWT